MATTRRIVIPTTHNPNGPYQTKQMSRESAETVSRLLHKNHDAYHLMYHDFGLHNHILHHLLCLYALGATPFQLEKAYDLNATYQIASRPIDVKNAQDLADPANFKKCLGKNIYFNDYFHFFQNEIDKKGVPATINEYLFSKDERAEDLFDRFFGGYLHCLIHLGYGLEYNQPFVVAEGLASVCVHHPEISLFLRGSEKAAQSSSTSSSLVDILDDIRTNKKVRKAMHFEYVDKIGDGLMPEAGEELFQLGSRWRVSPEELEAKTAEIQNACIYLTALAQRPDKEIRFDFLLMHTITAGAFLPLFLNAPWISVASKCRLMEWTGRADLLLYTESAAPELYPQELTTYRPQIPSGWDGVFRRACDYIDDGHTSKFIRGIATAAIATRPYADRKEFKIKRDEDFLKVAHMGTVLFAITTTGEKFHENRADVVHTVMDSVENFNNKTAEQEVHEIRKFSLYPRLMEPEVQLVIARWPKYVGFPESWDYIGDRKPAKESRL